MSLGWSDLPWYALYTQARVPAGRRAVCVSNDPADTAWASTMVSGQPRCTPARDLFGGATPCTTALPGNLPGTAQYCTVLSSTQEALVAAGLDPMTSATAGAVICQTQRVPRESMTNAQQRAVWDVKDKLCAQAQLVTDPGPVNAAITDRFRDAILRFQRDNGLATSGLVDQATVLALGFTPWQGTSIVSSLVGTAVGVERAPFSLTGLWPLAAAGGVILGGFFVYRRFFSKRRER